MADNDFTESLNAIHMPNDAGEHAVALEAIMQRIPDGWGRWISCDAGWYSIIIELDRDLAALDPEYELHQVKEKFGGLRFYAHTRNQDLSEAFNARIKHAEQLCDRTCETCGAPGKLHDEFSWIRTLCDRHAEERTTEEAARWRTHAAQVETDWPPLQARWGSGWAGILESLAKDLRGIDPQAYAMRLREQDGVLNVVVQPSDSALRDSVQARIAQAESDSATTCMRCGAPGEPHSSGGNWPVIYTLCPLCAEYRTRKDAEKRWSSPGRTVGDLRRSLRHGGTAPDAAPVMVPGDDGTLREITYPVTELVQVVERGGELIWVPVTGVVDGDRPVGGPVPALVLSPVADDK